METEIRKIQLWTVTGGYGCYNLRSDFGILNCDALDAPSYLASGSTIANEFRDDPNMPDRRVIVGNMTYKIR